MSLEKRTALRKLQRIPSIGKACTYDLWNIGIRKIDDLKDKNTKELYEQLNYVTGVRHDICMLHTFRCAVYFSSTRNPQPGKLRW